MSTQDKKDRTGFILALWVALVAAIVLLTFHVDSSANIDMVNRNIETPIKLWLNGYLGALTDQRAVGSIPLLFPIVLLALAFRKELPKYWVGVTIFIFLALVIIGYNGALNDRYQYTTMASIIFSVFILSTQLFKGNFKRYALYTILGVCVLNTGFQIGTHLWPKYSNRVGQLKEHSGASEVSQEQLFSGSIFDYINENLRGERFLVNNVPEFYVFTAEFGVFYWAGNDQVFLEKGPEWVFHTRNEADGLSFLKDELGADYVVTSTALSKYDPRFEKGLEKAAELVYQDGMENQIYRFIE